MSALYYGDCYVFLETDCRWAKYGPHTLEDEPVKIVELAYVGDNIAISCPRKTKPYWFKDGRPLDTQHIQFGNHLVLNKVDLNDNGHYSCGSNIHKVNLRVAGTDKSMLLNIIIACFYQGFYRDDLSWFDACPTEYL